MVTRLFLFAVFAVASACPADEPPKPARPLAGSGPRPKPVESPTKQQVDDAIRRGVDFFLADQRPDGSWGSSEGALAVTALYDPVPGAHHAFRAAVTSLAVSALLEVNDNRPEVAAALDRAQPWLIEHLPKLRRAEAAAIYNVWAHAFAIQALVKLHAHHRGNSAQQAELKKQIEQQIGFLDRFETVSGGWGYYDFNAGTKKPSGEPTSFTTATVLLAFHDAKTLGIEVPQKLIDRGLTVIRRQRRPDGAFLYDDAFRFQPQFAINHPGGSLGRSQVCNLCLRRYGDEKISDAVISAWLDRLFARNLWLDIGRKRPIPHESWFFVAGYFYYYGHYYAAECIEQLPADERAPHFAQLAHTLLPLQEDDGTWWDFPMYNYHRQYGTAFALMSLVRCRATAP